MRWGFPENEKLARFRQLLREEEDRALPYTDGHVSTPAEFGLLTANVLGAIGVFVFNIIVFLAVDYFGPFGRDEIPHVISLKWRIVCTACYVVPVICVYLSLLLTVRLQSDRLYAVGLAALVEDVWWMCSGGQGLLPIAYTDDWHTV